jgi:hypothetical protein
MLTIDVTQGIAVPTVPGWKLTTQDLDHDTARQCVLGSDERKATKDLTEAALEIREAADGSLQSSPTQPTSSGYSDPNPMSGRCRTSQPAGAATVIPLTALTVLPTPHPHRRDSTNWDETGRALTGGLELALDCKQ